MDNVKKEIIIKEFHICDGENDDRKIVDTDFCVAFFDLVDNVEELMDKIKELEEKLNYVLNSEVR